jgi:hypothetical protein
MFYSADDEAQRQQWNPTHPRRMTMKSLTIGLAALALLAVAPGAFAQDDMTQIRVAHLSPDAPNVDVWVDGSVALEDVPYEAVSGYLELAAGEHRIQITPTGD